MTGKPGDEWGVGSMERTEGKTVQLRLDAEAMETLERLGAATGAERAVDVLRDALGVYNALHALLQPGWTLALVSDDRSAMQELNVPTLARRGGR
jgi:hypothetical protein